MRYIVIILAIGLLSSCANQTLPDESKQPVPAHAIYAQLVKELTQQLNANNQLRRLDSPIVTTAFVWVDTYHIDPNPSTFHNLGMSLEEALSTELMQQGVAFKEYKVRPSIAVHNEGGYYLTRSSSELKDTIDAKYILVGTLSPIESGATVNAKIINYNNGDIISSANIHFPYESQFKRSVHSVNGQIFRN